MEEKDLIERVEDFIITNWFKVSWKFLAKIIQWRVMIWKTKGI